MFKVVNGFRSGIHYLHPDEELSLEDLVNRQMDQALLDRAIFRGDIVLIGEDGDLPEVEAEASPSDTDTE